MKKVMSVINRRTEEMNYYVNYIKSTEKENVMCLEYNGRKIYFNSEYYDWYEGNQAVDIILF